MDLNPLYFVKYWSLIKEQYMKKALLTFLFASFMMTLSAHEDDGCPKCKKPKFDQVVDV